MRLHAAHQMLEQMLAGTPAFSVQTGQLTFRKGVAQLEQMEDPFHAATRANNSLVRTVIHDGVIHTEIVVISDFVLYYAIHSAKMAPVLFQWDCARRLTRGDRLWNILQELDGWQLSFLAPPAVEKIVAAERDAAGDFMTDLTWMQVRAADTRVYIVTQEG